MRSKRQRGTWYTMYMFGPRVRLGWKLGRLNSTYLSQQEPAWASVAIEPDDAKVQRLLNNLAGLELKKVMIKRKEPLIPPHYQLMTLEQLQQVRKHLWPCTVEGMYLYISGSG